MILRKDQTLVPMLMVPSDKTILGPRITAVSVLAGGKPLARAVSKQPEVLNG